MHKYIDMNSALQAHPEFLNEQIDDHDKAVYAKGWNACNSAFYGAIKELPTISPDEVRGVGCDAADRLAAYEDTGLEPEEINDICHRFSCFLSEMTRNHMSKLNYTLEAMIQCAQDAHELDCEDYCFLKQAEKEETENGM